MIASSQINIDLQSFFASIPKHDLSTIDLGNSHPHLATFKSGKIDSVRKVQANEQEAIFEKPNVIASSVTKQLPQMKLLAEDLWQEQNFCHVPVHYAKEQMGRDRLYQAAFLYHLYLKQLEKQEIVLIDAGTFLTVDYISKDGILGGHIFQGYKTYISSFTRGDRLPNLVNEATLNLNSKIPTTTKEAINNAADIYLKSIIEGLIPNLKNKIVVITGGESDLIQEIISKLPLSADQTRVEPHLIHYSLYFLGVKLIEAHNQEQMQ
jgi:pantothenate kinase type III